MQIYKITNLINGKIYIGKDISCNTDYFGSGVLINKAILKYGKENFIKEIIEDNIENKKELAEKEKYWIQYNNSMDKKIGYNITNGGDGGDTISNNPNKENIVKKIKSKLNGRIFTEEHKNKLKQNHNSNNPEVVKKIADKLRGVEKSDFHKKNISKSISEYYKNNGGNLNFKGDNNPMRKFKYVWYTNEITNKSIRIKETDTIPDGYIKGRLNFKGDNNPMRNR